MQDKYRYDTVPNQTCMYLKVLKCILFCTNNAELVLLHTQSATLYI